MELQIGDKVRIYDEGLAMLQALTGGPPNNLGWVEEIYDDGDVLVKFPIGDDDPDEHSQVAPYPMEQVTRCDW